MTDGKITTEATKYRNEGVQIASAVTLYKANGNEIADGFSLNTLIEEGYLQVIPDGWEASSDSVTRDLDEDDELSEKVCFEANSQAGYSYSSTEDDVFEYSFDTEYGIPYCSMSDLSSYVPCCVQ
ncbi:hypothetical protein [Psychromonas sp. SP041]|uniref:hypothetical protein n=1 Tax=Psychromonas sp. SP041 TaxID=1365007 RepID=UPI0010C7BB1C|nr:hypothetical protein [Psychromonas sp. SP041]